VDRFCLSKKAVFAALTAMAALFAAGCGEREDDEGETVVDDAIERLLSESNPEGARIKTEHGLGTTVGGEQTYIGYGIKAFGGPTFGDALGAQLFKDAVYDTVDHGANPYISSADLPETQWQASLSENLNEVYSGLSVDAGGRSGEKVPWFSGGVKLQYGDSGSSVQSESKFYKYVSSRVTKKHSMIGRYAFDVTPLVKPDVINNIIDNTNYGPSDIFNRIGTHIITGASIGGEANIIGLYNSGLPANDKDIDTALNYNSYADKKTLTNEQKRIANETYLKINSFGGDGTIFAGASFTNFVSKMEAWVKTIEGKEVLANIYSLVPIWELATDPNRKAQMENYFYDYCNTQNGVLSKYFIKSLVVDGGTYEIESWLAPEMYIVVDNYSTAKYAQLLIWEKENTSAAVNGRKWVTRASDVYPGYFSFQNVNSGKVIGGDNGLIVDLGVMALQYDVGVSYSDVFRVVKNDDGSVYLFYKSLEIHGGYKVALQDILGAKGTKIAFSTDSGNGTKWKLHSVK